MVASSSGSSAIDIRPSLIEKKPMKTPTSVPSSVKTPPPESPSWHSRQVNT
jgi:hypothetical protein